MELEFDDSIVFMLHYDKDTENEHLKIGIPIINFNEDDQIYKPLACPIKEDSIYVEFLFPEFYDKHGDLQLEQSRIQCITLRRDTKKMTMRYLIRTICDWYKKMCYYTYKHTSQYKNLNLIRIYKLKGFDYYQMEFQRS